MTCIDTISHVSQMKSQDGVKLHFAIYTLLARGKNCGCGTFIFAKTLVFDKILEFCQILLAGALQG